ncbi:MAG: tyrosine-protein kinase [Solirubrobacteraceae bacterium]|jgi:capsular exopolysaccharide synthesis family protein|nr:tyrosine-protein kinase [Solirubrobacteraceae bacterium]
MTVPSDTANPLHRDYPRIFWRWKWLVLACVVAIPLLAFGLASRTQPQYSSSALLQVSGPAVDTSLFATLVVPTPQDAVLRSVARLVTTSTTASKAAGYLHPPPPSPRALLSQVTATADTAAGFITVTATDPSALRAADIANAFGQAVVVDRITNAKNQLTTAIGQLSIQLAGDPKSDVQGRLQLSDQLQRLRALRAAQTDNATIVEKAVPSASPSTPGVVRAVVLGLIIAVLLAIGLVLFAEGRDRRIRTAEEVESLTGLPLLGAIPATAFSGQELTEIDQEAFRTLRNSLTYFNIDRRISSVLITSPVKEDGKTTVATNLAVAMSRAGKDVILVEADLRRPAAALRFGVTQSVGLGAVLVDELALADALTVVDIPTRGAGRLRVLPAGPTPPNPSELIGSQRMRALIRELESSADVVILDSTPLLTVSDSLPLLETVSGVVLIARVNSTSHDSLIRLQRVVATAGGEALGVVATGVTGASSYTSYGYGYGYAESAAKNGRSEAVAADDLILGANGPPARRRKKQT